MGDTYNRSDCDKCCVPLNTVKARVRIFTWLVTAMITAMIVGNLWYIKASADPGDKVALANTSKDVEHNAQRIRAIEKSHEQLANEVRSVSDRLKNVEIMQSRALTILEGLNK